MYGNETFRRIRPIHGARRSRAGSAAQRHQRSGCGASETVRNESEQAWPEAQTKGRQSLRLGPRRKPRGLVGFRFFSRLASEINPRQTLAHDLPHCQVEALTIVHILPIVIAERLLVQIPEQMERLDANVGSLESPLDQTPKVLKPVRVNASTDVLDRV
jgi:hypothetical protein